MKIPKTFHLSFLSFCQFSKIFGHISNTAKFSVLSIFTAIIVYPLLSFVLTPILIYRYIISSIVQWWNPKYGSLLSGMDAVLACPEPYNTPLVIMSPYFPVSMKIKDTNQILHFLNNQIIKPNLFPNLKQRIVKKFGYFFWYNVDNFNVEDHVRYLHPDRPDTPVTRKEIRHLCGHVLGRMSFDPSRSPWELIVVPNFFDQNNPQLKSCIILRVNHCLMDGYSMLKFMQRGALSPWKASVEYKMKSSRQNSWWENFMAISTILLTGPFHAVNMLFLQNDTNEFLKNLLAENITKYRDGNAWSALESDPRKIDGETLKNIRHKYGVTVSSVLLALVVDGVIKFMRKRKMSMKGGLPKQIYLQTTFPVPHPDAMSNYWTFVRMPIEVSENQDAQHTLQCIHKEYESIKTSVIPIISYLMMNITGLLPAFMLPSPEESLVQTILLSNMPGPGKKVDLFGYDADEFGFSGCPTYGAAFIGAWQTMKGKFWVDMGGFRTLFPTQDDMLDLEDCMQEALNQLEDA